MLELAGATVYQEQYFGNYQGSWFALVEYEGKRLLISYVFGSCPGCDYLELLLDNTKEGETEKTLIQFGKELLADPSSWQELYESCQQSQSWDIETEEVIKFLEEYKRWLLNQEGNGVSSY